MHLQTLSLATLALLIFNIFFPTIGQRVASRIASRRRKTAYPYRVPSIDPFFNTDLILKALRTKKASRTREEDPKSFHDFKIKTFETFRFGHRDVQTCDSRNVQVCLATGSENFGVAEVRKPFVPFIGTGSMATDGEAWHKSRSSITPTFTRSHLAD